jgi:hypothetical protein
MGPSVERLKNAQNSQDLVSTLMPSKNQQIKYHQFEISKWHQGGSVSWISKINNKTRVSSSPPGILDPFTARVLADPGSILIGESISLPPIPDKTGRARARIAAKFLTHEGPLRTKYRLKRHQQGTRYMSEDITRDLDMGFPSFVGNQGLSFSW